MMKDDRDWEAVLVRILLMSHGDLCDDCRYTSNREYLRYHPLTVRQ